MILKETETLSSDPFSPQSMKEAKTKLLSSKIDRDKKYKLISYLNENGYVILESVINLEKVQLILNECRNLLNDVSTGSSSFGGFNTQRLFNLVARTRVLDDLILFPDLIAIVEGYLDDQIQLSVASLINVKPGETSQPLHRDDSLYPLTRPRMPLTVNAMWSITEFTKENGATLLLPGSHNLQDESAPNEPITITAEMPAGSVILYSGSLFHAAGSNLSDSERLGLSVVYSRAWLRQQENQFLGVPPEIARTLPRQMQKLVGYWVVNNFLGYLNNESPSRLLD
jgi:ectoine hydroxylase-related dioxygenase (phytanoyl-CoA dioxygenase family)